MAALVLVGATHAETVARYGISMADIPLTTGQPDRGAGAYQFTGHTIYDPLALGGHRLAVQQLDDGVAVDREVGGLAHPDVPRF